MKKVNKSSIFTLIAIVAVVLLVIWFQMTGKEGETMDSGPKEIYLAGGCFWGVERYFNQIKGVLSTEVGYANSTVENPRYEEVCYGQTGAVEVVRIVYDAKQAPLSFLLKQYYRMVDPTKVNRQGNDIGVQYRTGIYYMDKSDRIVIEESLQEVAARYYDAVVVECEPLENYYQAETYHQQYLEKNKGGYCHINLDALERAKRATPSKEQGINIYVRQTDEELRKVLTKEQYQVTRENATEVPFVNAYWDQFDDGLYVDVTTGEPLFLSGDKFECSCGWPSFSRPISRSVLKEQMDIKDGLVRTEVRSVLGNAHLGHVFEDVPEEKGGLRYCINSASLRFVPVDKMEAEGYIDYISRVTK